MPLTLQERIERRIAIDEITNCWNWTAGKDERGYGRVAIGANKYKRSHRAYYELVVGQVPDGLVLDHLCANPSCLNPAHLEPVTQKENVRRGRMTKHICKHGNAMNGCIKECADEYQRMWRNNRKVN